MLTGSHKDLRHANRSVLIRDAILILAIAAQGEPVQLIEHTHTPTGGELTVPEKTTVALPPRLA